MPDRLTVSDSIPSVHILGSRQFGGADQFYVRLVIALNQAGHRAVALSRPHSPVAAALTEAGAPQYPIPMANQWDVWSMWRINQYVRTSEVRIIQTYMGRATRLSRFGSRDNIVHIARLGGYYKIDGYYRHANAWVGNTRRLCDYLVQSGLSAERVFYIGNFVPEPEPVNEARLQAVRRQYAIPNDAWTVFALARMTQAKGIDTLLDAWSKLPTEVQGRPLVLLLAGEGPLLQRLQDYSRQLKLQQRLIWLGWQNQPALFYQLADVFVCPSRHEPLGNVILEAWSYQLPVVSTTTFGGQELIQDGCNGVLTPCDDGTALAARLLDLLRQPGSERQRLAEAGWAELQAKHSQQAVLDAYLSLYRRLLDRPSN